MPSRIIEIDSVFAEFIKILKGDIIRSYIYKTVIDFRLGFHCKLYTGSEKCHCKYFYRATNAIFGKSVDLFPKKC